MRMLTRRVYDLSAAGVRGGGGSMFVATGSSSTFGCRVLISVLLIVGVQALVRRGHDRDLANDPTWHGPTPTHDKDGNRIPSPSPPPTPTHNAFGDLVVADDDRVGAAGVDQSLHQQALAPRYGFSIGIPI